MHAVFLIVMEKLNSGKIPYASVFTDLQAVAWPYGQAGGQREPSLLKGCPYGLREIHLLDWDCCLLYGPAQWLNLMSFPKVEKFGYKWREGKTVAMGKRMNKWFM